ncbi:protein DEHYDRATION-INDUCED 19 homolog 3-like isoform X1 [Hibiscus syriacus]|uniref:protein DEHYDRATION-INDUCED 19 homolog 3-like isoform X1 n=1 Tax=Hibiscus syriacus TaxID=106335 RepID=UPI001922D3DA|nr:protein DEHYDRATION-INDUCED 19 homolog 3-like isoform X1 [Hibiscus syriacus]XP_039061864.1 protein DEHYDRATION-INDUCED 19 homolog 3-like isoform X1 [Hibiscus syriacus]
MEDDTWSFSFSAPSRSYQSTLKSHSDLCIDFEEIEEDDELMTEYPCPYCSEDFDLLGLCCHIDEEHHLEAGYRVCPVCAQRVGMNMVDHITTQHGNIFKSNHKLNFHKGDSLSPLSSLRKELHDAHYQSLLSRSWSSLSSSNTGPDPLVSFLYSAPPADSSGSVQPASSTEVTLEEKGSDAKMIEKDVHPLPLSDKEHWEKANKCEFVQGLLLSTIFDGGL